MTEATQVANPFNAQPAAVGASTPAAPTLVVNPAFNNLIDKIDTSFFFKKVKDETTGLESKRATVVIPMPRPSVEGIKYILEHADTPEGVKALELLLEATGDVISARARQILNDPTGESITSDTFPLAELDWQTIANLPKSDRRESAIPKEVWDDFAKDYISVMPTVTGKPLAKVALAAKVFLKKFAIGDVKQDKQALALLRSQLALYISNTTNGESFMDVVDWLDKKAEQLINAKPEEIGSAL